MAKKYTNKINVSYESIPGKKNATLFDGPGILLGRSTVHEQGKRNYDLIKF